MGQGLRHDMREGQAEVRAAWAEARTGLAYPGKGSASRCEELDVKKDQVCVQDAQCMMVAGQVRDK